MFLSKILVLCLLFVSMAYAVNTADKEPKKEPKQKSERFSCDGRPTCKQISSCAEARFYLEECGLTKLDRDHDGIPCESLCN